MFTMRPRSGKFAPDTAGGRIKHRAMRLLAEAREPAAVDTRDLDFTVMPVRRGYDDSIFASSVGPEFSIDDSWAMRDEESAPGVGQWGASLVQAGSAAASAYGQMQAAKASEKASAAQLKAAKEGRKAAEAGTKGSVQVARLQLQATKTESTRKSKLMLAAIIGTAVVALGVGAFFFLRRKKK